MNSIRTALLKLKGIRSVEILKEEDRIFISGDGMDRQEIILKLAQLGYPEKGNNSALSKAKPFVSCAIGKMSS